MAGLIQTDADKAIKKCLDERRSFALIAGAGSGKTTSLITALKLVRDKHDLVLRQSGRRIACITYTNRAVDVINKKLEFDDLYRVSTIHGFMWKEISGLQNNIRVIIRDEVIPGKINKLNERNSSLKSQNDIDKNNKIISDLVYSLEKIHSVEKFEYGNVEFSDYCKGQLSHDDVVELAGHFMNEYPLFCLILGQKYPYIFIDEAQDTFPPIVDAINRFCTGGDYPLVGYFGDPYQNIYKNRSSNFRPPCGGEEIKKIENFRSSGQVIQLLNGFRNDVEQSRAGKNRDIEGSVLIRIIKREVPKGARKKYSDDQQKRLLVEFDRSIDAFGWRNCHDTVYLFLTWKMIARRAGYIKLHEIFDRKHGFVSLKANEEFNSASHYLFAPFIKTILPLLEAYKEERHRDIVNILRENAFPDSVKGKSIMDVADDIKLILEGLAEDSKTKTTKEILIYCEENNLLKLSSELAKHLNREPRAEAYDEGQHGDHRDDWLADQFFNLRIKDIENFERTKLSRTPFRTQHGEKGEEFKNVVVYFDDTEASWTDYNFEKLLSPNTSSPQKENQMLRSRNLAYVALSRACINLRIVLIHNDPQRAKDVFIRDGLFTESQIEIIT